MKSILLLIILSFSTTTFSQTKIGVINKQQLLDSLPSRRVVLNEIGQIETSAVKELIAMDSLLNAKIEFYQKHPEINPIKPLNLENEMRQLQNRISEREKEVDEVLAKLASDCNSKSEMILNEATKIVSEKLLLDFAIDAAETVYFNDKLDITNAVLIEMLKIDESVK